MFEHLKSRAEAAQSEYERAYAQLFRDAEKREKLYSDDEHRTRVRVLEQERARKLDAEIEEIRREVEEASMEISLLENGDVTSLVSADELAAAAAKKPFAEDDIGGLSEGDLAGKLRAVLDGGDRAAVFAYWRAGSARLQSMSGVAGPEGLREVLDQMRDFLAGPERLARVARAREKIEAALEVELLASNLKVGARSSAEAWTNRQRERARRQRAGA